DGGDEPPRGGRSTRDPQRGPSASTFRGTAPPEPAPEVVVLLLLCDAGPPRGGGAPSGLALLPTLPRGGEPSLHGRGARTVRRGVVAAGRGGRDGQLLPRLSEAVAEGSRGQASPTRGSNAGHLGGARLLPRLRSRRARSRRCAQPRPRGAAGRRVALGP